MATLTSLRRKLFKKMLLKISCVTALNNEAGAFLILSKFTTTANIRIEGLGTSCR